MEAKTTFESFDQYLESLPAVAADRFRELSQVVVEEMPGAEQVISYGIPTFRLDGKNLVHIAGYKRHVGLYGTGAMEALEAEVAPYKTGKGTLQFLHSEPLPVPLIRKIVAARVREHRAQRSP